MTWFPGPDLQGSRELAFVAALRTAAGSGSFPGVEPADTIAGLLSRSVGPGVTVGLAVPKLTCGRR